MGRPNAATTGDGLHGDCACRRQDIDRAARRRWKRRHLIRLVGGSFLAMATIVVVLLRATGLWTQAQVTYRLLGSFAGLSVAIVHLPNGKPTASLGSGWLITAVIALLALAVYVMTLPWHTPSLANPELRNPQVFFPKNFALMGVTPIAMACIMARHPPSTYIYDAVWSVTCTWFNTLLLTLYHDLKGNGGEIANFNAFVISAALHVEGVTFVWNACLMVRRLCVVSSPQSFGARHSTWLIGAMGLAFHLRLWLLVLETCNLAWLDTFSAHCVNLTFGTLFLGVWLFYTFVVTGSLSRSALMLRREAQCVRGAPQAEALWASKMLGYEVLACIALGVSTTSMWSTIMLYRVMTWWSTMDVKVVVEVLVLEHRVDLLLSAASVALLSGLVWQPKEPSPEALQCRPRNLHKVVSYALPDGVQDGDEHEAWIAKVEELAGRGVALRSLLDFWEDLACGKIMPKFDPSSSTTNDVVRQAIIPQSRAAGGGALAAAWSRGKPLIARCMVTHNWSNRFVHLIAGILADALNEDYYEGVASMLISGDEGIQAIRRRLADLGRLEVAYWVCAFSVNQHASICNGFGPSPGEDDERAYEEWDAKRRDSVTGEIYPVCPCHEPKISNSDPANCEVNKFDAMMRFLHEASTDFSHLVVVDMEFDLFTRAWCIAEIVESDLSGISQRILLHSQEMLDYHYDSLSLIDVRNCKASRVEDKELILKRINDPSSFNVQLQWTIFGTKGLFSKWLDGQERAALIGRIVRRAMSAGGNSNSLSGSRLRLGSSSSNGSSLLHVNSGSSNASSSSLFNSSNDEKKSSEEAVSEGSCGSGRGGGGG